MQYSKVAEARQDFGQAEACLLEAVRLDKTFAPRWSLSEYYYRRRDTAHYWPAVKAALAVSYDDVTPLFQRCWDLAASPDAILRVIRNRADVLSQYLEFLINEKKRLDLALPVAARLRQYRSPDSTPAMLSLYDRLLEAGQVSEAVDIWDGLAADKLVPYNAISPERGDVVTNGKLAQPFLERGFDWRMPAVEGVYVRAAGAIPPLRFAFSGKQPKIVSFLASGCRCRKVENAGCECDIGQPIWKAIREFRGDWWTQGAGWISCTDRAGWWPPRRQLGFVFATPDNTRLAKLTLGYKRVLGTGRITGSISRSEVSTGFAK